MFYRSLLLPDLRESLAENDVPAMAEFCNALYPAVLAEVATSAPTPLLVSQPKVVAMVAMELAGVMAE